jgi:TolB protein
MRKYFLLLLSLISITSSALELQLTKGVGSALPISLVPFYSNNAHKEADLVANLIKKDLKSSGRFKFLKGKDSIIKSSLDVDFSQWRMLGVNYLVIGRLFLQEDNKYYVSVDLLDPLSKAHLVLSRDYHIQPKDLRSLAHHISDIIYQQLTGEKGIFATRIAYIKVNYAKGTHKPQKYSLEITDFDGQNPQTLLSSTQPIMSPSWSPDGNYIAYVSFENRRSEIFVVNVRSGERELISSYPGINGSPSWSPDGKKLAIVLSKSGDPKIYLINLINKQLTQLTFSSSIDTEPSFSKDGKSVIFTSDRGGAPQIYRLNLKTKQVTRLTFSGNYNASASLSPDNHSLVLMHRKNKRFAIGVQDLETGELLPVTFNGKDESPTLSPNGRMILYASEKEGFSVLKMVSIDGKVQLNLPSPEGGVQEPAWSPFLG